MCYLPTGAATLIQHIPKDNLNLDDSSSFQSIGRDTKGSDADTGSWGAYFFPAPRDPVLLGRLGRDRACVNCITSQPHP